MWTTEELIPDFCNNSYRKKKDTESFMEILNTFSLFLQVSTTTFVLGGMTVSLTRFGGKTVQPAEYGSVYKLGWILGVTEFTYYGTKNCCEMIWNNYTGTPEIINLKIYETYPEYKKTQNVIVNVIIWGIAFLVKIYSVTKKSFIFLSFICQR